jgi:diguanylate cyclase (GGDEF)-like protein
MGVGLRTKEALVIILLTFAVVATTTLIHLSQLTPVVIEEVSGQAELIAKQIYAQSRRSLSQSHRRNPRDILRGDRELRNLLEASVGYSPYLVYALIADRQGRTILHSEDRKEGSNASSRPAFQELLSLGPIGRFQALYREGKVYEAALPLSLNGKPFGSIRLGIATSLLRRELNASVRQGVAVAALALPLAWLVAMGFAHRKLGELRAMSLIDELTGLNNRRGFLFLAQQHMKIANRTKRGMLVLYADLDRMKEINDRLGHREGDQALIDTAAVLKESFREADIIARIGGDEFAVIAIEAGKDSAEILEARLRDNFDARNARGDRRYTLAISVGIARYDPDSPCSLDELLARADASMYEQKHGKHQS